MAKWRWILWEQDAAAPRDPSGDSSLKPHGVPASLMRALIADLSARGYPGTPKIKDSVHMNLDEPGMCRTDRPWETVYVEDLKLEFPCEDVTGFIDRLQRKCPVRTFAPCGRGKVHRPYVKLHNWRCCLVLTPRQCDTLLRELRGVQSHAEKTAAVFYADKQQTGDVLREIAAKTSGVPIEKIPDLGGRNNRFIPKHRGQA